MSSSRQLILLTAITLALAACGGSGSQAMQPVPPSNSAPVISAIGDRSGDQDTDLVVDFSVDDRESGAGSLKITASADGTSLFPADGVVLGGSGATRRLTLTPLEAATGSAMLSIRVEDADGAAATRNFAVAVNARNNSMRSMALETFAKAEGDPATTLNGWTIQQDADDPALFAPFIPEGEE